MFTEENLKILVPLLTAILGYLFGKWNSERTRKWEVKDRHLTEARAYLETYRSIVESIQNHAAAFVDILTGGEEFVGLSHSEIAEKVDRKYGKQLIAFEEMTKLLWDIFEMNTSIVILGDKRLSKLDAELRSLLTPEIADLKSFREKIDEGAKTGEMYKHDVEKEFDKVLDFSAKAHLLITRMKLRLGELAQKT